MKSSWSQCVICSTSCLVTIGKVAGDVTEKSLCPVFGSLKRSVAKSETFPKLEPVNMAHLTKEQLRDTIVAHGIEAPALSSAKKDEFLAIYESQGLAQMDSGLYSSDDEAGPSTAQTKSSRKSVVRIQILLCITLTLNQDFRSFSPGATSPRNRLKRSWPKCQVSPTTTCSKS